LPRVTRVSPVRASRRSTRRGQIRGQMRGQLPRGIRQTTLVMSPHYGSAVTSRSCISSTTRSCSAASAGPSARRPRTSRTRVRSRGSSSCGGSRTVIAPGGHGSSRRQSDRRGGLQLNAETRWRSSTSTNRDWARRLSRPIHATGPSRRSSFRRRRQVSPSTGVRPVLGVLPADLLDAGDGGSAVGG